MGSKDQIQRLFGSCSIEYREGETVFSVRALDAWRELSADTREDILMDIGSMEEEGDLEYQKAAKAVAALILQMDYLVCDRREGVEAETVGLITAVMEHGVKVRVPATREKIASLYDRYLELRPPRKRLAQGNVRLRVDETDVEGELLLRRQSLRMEWIDE